MSAHMHIAKRIQPLGYLNSLPPPSAIRYGGLRNTLGWYKILTLGLWLMAYCIFLGSGHFGLSFVVMCDKNR